MLTAGASHLWVHPSPGSCFLPGAAPGGSPWAWLGAHLTTGLRGCSASLSAGRTTIGTAAKDIVLQGPGLAPEHCYIENVRGTLTLHPCNNACTIDGVMIQQPTRLTQGRAVDRSRLAAPGQDPAIQGTAVQSDSTHVSGAILPLPVPRPQLLAGGVAVSGVVFAPKKTISRPVADICEEQRARVLRGPCVTGGAWTSSSLHSPP